MKHSKRVYWASSLTIAAIAVTSLSFAGGVPLQLTEQGRLLDTSGAPIDGSIPFAFALYATATGGTPLWSEQQTLTLQNGYLTAQLGTQTPLPVGTFTGAVLYLGIAANGDPEMTPRQTVSSVPYAVVATNAIGDITPTSVTVGDAAVISAAGQWVGASTIAYASATQTAALQTVGPTFTDVPGAAITLVVARAGMTDLLAHGSINPVGGTGSMTAGYCGFRFVVDGTPMGDPTWGNVIAGGAPSQWVPWTMGTNLPLAPGQHTVSVQQCGYTGTSAGCSSVAAAYSAATVRAMSF